MTTVINFDSIDPAKLQDASHDEIVAACAAIRCMESMLFEARLKVDSWSDPVSIAENIRLGTREDELCILYATRFRDKCHLVEFRGESDGLGHYEIEDHMEAHLGKDGIAYDSESGWFVVDTTEGRADEVEVFLKTHHPYLNFDRETITELDNVRPPMMNNWTAAKQYLKDRDIELDYTVPKLPPKSGKKLEEALEEARLALRKTGLPLDKAIALL